MNDLQSWLHSSVEKAKFFLTDLTRKPIPDVVAIVEQDQQFVKGVIVVSMRRGDIGALWWTILDDVQVGLEVGYFDISSVKPVLRATSPPASANSSGRSASQSPHRAPGRPL